MAPKTTTFTSDYFATVQSSAVKPLILAIMWMQLNTKYLT